MIAIRSRDDDEFHSSTSRDASVTNSVPTFPVGSFIKFGFHDAVSNWADLSASKRSKSVRDPHFDFRGVANG